MHKNIVTVVIKNKAGKYFVHQRNSDKATFPNFYALGIGGHAEDGEDIQSAASRELKEEVGLTEPIKFLFEMNMENIGLNQTVHIHELIYDKEIKNCDEEWQWSGWMSENEVDQLVKDDKLCLDTAEYYDKYKTKIESEKIALIADINDRINSIIKDCRTFLFAKSKYKNQKEDFWGGGNFLCCQGAFAALNLLAKINCVLEWGKVCTEKDIENQKDEIKEYKKTHEEDDKILKNLKPNPKNTTVKPEKECFVGLWKITTPFINWGIEDEKFARQFWESYRNSLAHVNLPKLGVAAERPTKFDNLSVRKYIKDERWRKANIYGKNSRFNGKLVNALAVEMLWESLQPITEFLNSRIKACKDFERLNNIKIILQ